jgi:hypothetical protein
MMDDKEEEDCILGDLPKKEDMFSPHDWTMG